MSLIAALKKTIIMKKPDLTNKSELYRD